MFSTEYLKKIYECYDKEINTQSFQDVNMQTLLKTLILYKELSKNTLPYDSAVGDEDSTLSPLCIHSMPKEVRAIEKRTNSIITFYVESQISELEWFDEDGWYQELLSTFVNRQLNIKEDEEEQCKIYIDTDCQAVYIGLPNSISLSGMQLLLCGLISKLMPWFFSSVEREVVVEITKVLDNHGNDDFNKLFESTVRDAGIVQKIMESDLQKLGERLKKSELETAEQRVKSYQDQVNEYFAALCENNGKLREAKNRLAAIKMGDDRDSGVKEIVDFLQSTPQDITISDIDDCTVKVLIRSTLQVFDEWEMYANMEYCYLYEQEDDGRGVEYNDKNKRAYTELFSNPDFKIHTATGISFDLRNGRVNGFIPDYTKNESRHPHINSSFSCFGTAGPAIAEYIQDFRYTEALNQIMYVARQFTVSDGAAGNNLLIDLHEKECIELPNGEFVNWQGFVEYLDEETKGEAA